MRRRRFDVQVLIVLLFVVGVFVSSLLIRVAENPFGLFAEPNELTLYCDDLLGLHERAELRCRGAVVGHVKSIQWGTRGIALATIGKRAIAGNRTAAEGPERFWIRAGVNNRYGAWKFARTGYIRGAVMESAVTPGWIELIPASASDSPAAAGSSTEIELVVDKSKPGAEGLAEKVTEIGDALLDLVHVINPPPQPAAQSGPGANGANPQPSATPPIQKIVTMIDDMSKTTQSLHEFAIRLEERSSDEELSKALQALKAAVAKLHEHVTEADGAVQETKAAMSQFKKAAKKTDVSATKFNDLVDRVGDTTLGRALIRKKSPSPSPPPR
jgi:ABC-type transporter Mla subunit MlaD